jgi:hypothetical protein
MTKQQEIVMIIVNKRTNVLNKNKKKKVVFTKGRYSSSIQKCTRENDKDIYIKQNNSYWVNAVIVLFDDGISPDEELDGVDSSSCSSFSSS